jgi:hypothetical protein
MGLLYIHIHTSVLPLLEAGHTASHLNPRLSTLGQQDPSEVLADCLELSYGIHRVRTIVYPG